MNPEKLDFDMTSRLLVRPIENKQGQTNKEEYRRFVLEIDSIVAEESKNVFTNKSFTIEKSDIAPGSSEAALERRKVGPDCNQCNDDPKNSSENCACHK